MKPIAHLPSDAKLKLSEFKSQEDPSQFLEYLLGLRKAGWPLRSIAEPFDVTRVTAKNWETRALQLKVTPEPQVPPLPLDVRGMKVRPKRIPPGIPSRDRERIAALSVLARRVRRWTLDDSDEKRAANELEELIYRYVVERQVPAAVFARYAGVTRRAIMQRVEKIKDDIIPS